jgi:Fe2+ or Zn2+ uptake regulation protein
LKLAKRGRQHLKRFGGRAEDHNQARCLRCDRRVDACVELCVGIDRSVGEALDFPIVGQKPEFAGTCPQCRSRSVEPPTVPDKPTCFS